MTDLPVYVWVLVFAAALAAPLTTAWVVKGRAGVVLALLWPVWAAVAALLLPPVQLAVAGAFVAGLVILWRTQATARQLAHPQTFRVVGGVFLIAMGFGALPPGFALPAGLGDIAIGIAAPFVARGRLNVLWFHLLGLLDLVVALVVGTLLQPSTLAVTQLPLILIPATLVPLALAAHIVAIRRSLA